MLENICPVLPKGSPQEGNVVGSNVNIETQTDWCQIRNVIGNAKVTCPKHECTFDNRGLRHDRRRQGTETNETVTAAAAV